MTQHSGYQVDSSVLYLVEHPLSLTSNHNLGITQFLEDAIRKSRRACSTARERHDQVEMPGIAMLPWDIGPVTLVRIDHNEWIIGERGGHAAHCKGTREQEDQGARTFLPFVYARRSLPLLQGRTISNDYLLPLGAGARKDVAPRLPEGLGDPLEHFFAEFLLGGEC
jgi:hypothetical protein